MGINSALNFDKDFCPLLTAFSANQKTSKSEPVLCRPDCAWRDNASDCCVLMGINVQLKILNDHLAEIEKSGIVLDKGDS